MKILLRLKKIIFILEDGYAWKTVFTKFFPNKRVERSG